MKMRTVIIGCFLAALSCVPAQAESFQNCDLTKLPPEGQVNDVIKKMGTGTAALDDKGYAFIKDSAGKTLAETELPCTYLGYQQDSEGEVTVCSNYAAVIKAEEQGFLFIHIVKRGEDILWTAKCPMDKIS